DRLQRPLPARHHGTASGHRGGVPAGRCRLAHVAGRRLGQLGALRADAHAGLMAQPRPESRILAFPATPRPMPAASPAGPYVARLMVTDFRCYRQAALETDHRPVVLTGPNGAGKTNLLEALSFLAPGRGLRQAKLAEVDRRNGAAANG